MPGDKPNVDFLRASPRRLAPGPAWRAAEARHARTGHEDDAGVVRDRLARLRAALALRTAALGERRERPLHPPVLARAILGLGNPVAA